MKQRLTRELIAMRVARELEDGMFVNLGYGLPTLVSDYLPPGKDIVLHAEHGVLGYGPIVAEQEKWDIDMVNGGGQPVVMLPGGCVFDFATSFGMIRGRHLDLTVMGAYQVSEKGDLANWRVGKQVGGGIGGAMELAIGAKRVIVAMEHTTPGGKPRIVKECSYSLTARRCVNLIVTDLAVIRVTPSGLQLEEVAPGWTPEEVQALTEPKLQVSEKVREIEV